MKIPMFSATFFYVLNKSFDVFSQIYLVQPNFMPSIKVRQGCNVSIKSTILPKNK